jgi:Vanadium chloroperoxidase N-terminal domain/PAP2 superfamily
MMLHLLSPSRKRNRQGKSGPSPHRRGCRLALEGLEERCLLSADPVLFWNQVALQAAVTDHGISAPGLQFGPTRTSRALAIVSGAVYDAVNSIHPQASPYLIQMPAPRNASIDAAVAEAAYTTLVNLYPYQQPYFQTQLKASLQGLPLVPMLEGLVVGGVVGADYNLTRADDGSQIDAPGHQPPYTYGQQPGQWRADPLHPDATPLTPDWGLVTPFVVRSATQFGAPPPPAITSLAYATAYEQVKAIGAADAEATGARTENETNIGFFWGYDAQPGLCAPVRFFNQIVGEVARQAGNTVEQNARLFALANFAMADAAITCWNDKYRDDYWRPVTAIRAGDAGLNPLVTGDPTWTPLWATPPFPSYVSGHSTFSAAAAAVLDSIYGTNVAFTDPGDPTLNLTPRHYANFDQAAQEAGISRIYGGIHYSFDNTAGLTLGTQVGNYVISHELAALKTSQAVK